jgi:hypothetical protein
MLDNPWHIMISFLLFGENSSRMLKNCFTFLSSYPWMMLQFSIVTYFGDSMTQPVSDLCIACCACGMCSDRV